MILTKRKIACVYWIQIFIGGVIFGLVFGSMSWGKFLVYVTSYSILNGLVAMLVEKWLFKIYKKQRGIV